MRACNQVRARKWWMVLAALAVGLVVGTAQGIVIVEDDFSGAAGPADALKWSVVGPGSAALTGAGTVEITHPGGGGGLTALGAFAYVGTSDTNRGRLTVVSTAHSGNSILGLNNVPDTDWILIRNDGIGGAFWRVEMDTSAATPKSERVLTVPETSVGTWAIQWYSGHVDISFNGSPVFNSDTDAPVSGSWTIPTVAMKPFLFAYAGTTDTYDSVLWETIPEPSTLGLLGIAFAVLGARRFRR